MGRVFVAGSINMDVVATADRHPRIGETIAGNAVLYFPGGKGANQAVAAAKLGAPTTLIGRLGRDAFGDELKAFLTAQGVDLTFVQQTADAHTGTAIITVANADNTIVVVPGANALVSAGDVEAPVFVKGDIAVSQFEIPLPTVRAFFKRARAAGATTILNPAPAIEFDAEMLDLVDILILNESELGFLTKTELHDTDDYPRFIEAARSLQMDEKTVCVTLGKRGIAALIDGRPHMDLGRAVDAVIGNAQQQRPASAGDANRQSVEFRQHRVAPRLQFADVVRQGGHAALERDRGCGLCDPDRHDHIGE